jgi:chromosome condensin MukBEF ATPase and DNA-binding subunit MukB
MNRILLLFLSISSLAFGQIRESRKIIIINNTDTTILSTDTESMASDQKLITEQKICALKYSSIQSSTAWTARC